MDYRYYVKNYVKLPVEVEAIPVIKGIFPAIREWLGDAFIDTVYLSPTGKVTDEYTNNWGILIRTIEGELVADENSFIIKGVKNDFYPIRKDIFYQTYKLNEKTLEEYEDIEEIEDQDEEDQTEDYEGLEDFSDD